MGRIDPDTARDLAADKALEILQKFDRGEWRPQDATPAQTVAFFRILARNALVDYYRKEGRQVRSDEIAARTPTPGPAHSSRVERSAFAHTLRDCAATLTERARTIWFLRAFHEMSSQEIAAHPEVQSTPTAVDMAFSRARQQIRECMEAKGYDPTDVVPGTFVVIWETFRRARHPEPKREARDEATG